MPTTARCLYVLTIIMEISRPVDILVDSPVDKKAVDDRQLDPRIRAISSKRR